MKSTLTSTDRENFWIRVYLGPNKDLISASIDRAYLDFNRTLHGFAKLRSTENYSYLKDVVSGSVAQLLNRRFIDQKQFDEWHQSQCNTLVHSYKEALNFKLYQGQAQKWLNMSFKYLYSLGDSRVPSISDNYMFFHVPIDNIIQDKFKSQGINRLQCSWSRIKTYEQYLDYQILVRNKYPNRIPMDVEFELFNELN